MAYSRYATEMKDGDNNIYGLMDEEARAQLSDLKSALIYSNMHGKGADLVCTIEDARINYNVIESYPGNSINVYRLKHGYTYYVKTFNNSNKVAFLVSKNLFTAPSSAVLTLVQDTTKDEYIYSTEEYNYLYITSKRVANASYSSLVVFDMMDYIEESDDKISNKFEYDHMHGKGVDPVTVIENAKINYNKIASSTGDALAVYEIKQNRKYYIKAFNNSNKIGFLVSQGLYTAPSDVELTLVQDTTKDEYEYVNSSGYNYLYLASKRAANASFYSMIVMDLIEKINSIDKVDDVNYIKVQNTAFEYDHTHGKGVDPVAVIENAKINYNIIESSTGDNITVYKLEKGRKYFVKAFNNSNKIGFLVSKNLFTAPSSAVLTLVQDTTKDEYIYSTEEYNYLYIMSKRAANALFYSTIVMDIIDYIPKEYEFPMDIVCTYKNMYVANDNGILKFSDDNMATWPKEIDVSQYGLIKTYHLFDNGCIAFFTHQNAYYSEDWETVYPASVYESDGVTAYTPSQYDNFTTTKEYKDRKYVGNQDLYVFGNYGITNETHTRRNIYASFDNGHSYKVLYEFNVSGALTIRHVHTVVYNPNFDKFICLTGDSQQGSNVIEFEISNSSMQNMTVLGNGIEYKWAGIEWWGADVYYCLDTTPGKVLKCAYNEIGDITKHQITLDNLPSDCIGIFIGDRGDMLVTLSTSKTGQSNSPFSYAIDCLKIYYSPDRVNFTMIYTKNISKPHSQLYYGFFGVNSYGEIVSGVKSTITPLVSWDKLPSVSLSDIVRKNGFANAFKPYDSHYEIVPVLSMDIPNVTVVEDEEIDIPIAKYYPYNATVKEYEVIEWDNDIIHYYSNTILGWQPGESIVKVRSRSNYDVTAEFTVTVTPKQD